MKILALKLGLLCIALGPVGLTLAETQMGNAESQTNASEGPDSVVVQPVIQSAALIENNSVTAAVQSNSLNTAVEKRCWSQALQDKKVTKAGFVQSMIKITQDSPKGTFKTGDSAFEVVALPGYKKEYRLEISLVFDHNLRKQSEVMVPSIVIVDEGFCEISDLPKLKFIPTYGVFAAVEVEKAFVVINDEKPKYALVYTDAKFSNSEVNVTSDFGYGMQSKERFLRVSYGYTNIRINK